MNVKGIFDGVFGESKAKYTPGPWSLSANYHQTQKVVSDSCEIVKLPPTEVGKANAHLIAAAPDLLECLHMMAAELAHQEKHGPRSVPAWLTNMYVQVTAKAKGES